MSSYSTRSSPHNDRIYQISERLAGIQVSIETDKGSKVNQLESRIDLLFEKFEDSQEQANKKFNTFKDQVFALQNSLSQTIDTRESYFQQRSNELLDREDAFKGLFGDIDHSKRESDQKLHKLLDDRINSLRNEITRENKVKSEGLESIKQYFNQKIPLIQEMLKAEVINREKTQDELAMNMTKEIEKSQNLIFHERKAREETEEAMLVMLQDLVSRMKNEIEQERNEREESEETLLNLLEETCGKLNTITKF